MSKDLSKYLALGQTKEEALLLAEHDEGETLHYYYVDGDSGPYCAECGDTSDGLMHNNTWRNVEPLMDQE